MNIPTTTFVQQAPNQKDEGLYRVWFNQIGSFINGSQAVKENKIMNGNDEIGKAISIRIGNLVSVCGELSVVPGVTYSSIELIPIAPQLRTTIFLAGLGGIVTIVQPGQYSTSFYATETNYCFNVCYIAETKKR